MGVLKRLYRAGILVKRSKCSSASLLPYKLTYTETISKPWSDFLQGWVNLIAGVDNDKPDFITESIEITDSGAVEYELSHSTTLLSGQNIDHYKQVV